MAEFFIEFEVGQPRPASYDPAVPIYERKTLRVNGVNCMARREARALLAQGGMRLEDRVYPRVLISMSARRPLSVPSALKFVLPYEG